MKIVLYGISGAEDKYRVAKYCFIERRYFSIIEALDTAYWMKLDCPSIEHVYAIDNSKELKRDFIKCIKENSIESFLVFKDILETEGLKII